MQEYGIVGLVSQQCDDNTSSDVPNIWCVLRHVIGQLKIQGGLASNLYCTRFMLFSSVRQL
jgi:hypothetical protein